MQSVWKNAPVICEFFGPGNTNFSIAIQDVQQLHVSAMGNGNIEAWATLTSLEQQQYLQMGKLAGYRLVLNQVSFPTFLVQGNSFSVVSSWTNVGVAPIYENWKINFQLRPSFNTTSWTAISGFNLTFFFPNQASTNFTDTFSFPTVALGTYQFGITIIDPTGYRRPMALAINGTDATGFYALANITVTAPVTTSLSFVTTNPSTSASSTSNPSSSTSSNPSTSVSSTSVATSNPSTSTGSNSEGKMLYFFRFS